MLKRISQEGSQKALWNTSEVLAQERQDARRAVLDKVVRRGDLSGTIKRASDVDDALKLSITLHRQSRAESKPEWPVSRKVRRHAHAIQGFGS